MATTSYEKAALIGPELDVMTPNLRSSQRFIYSYIRDTAYQVVRVFCGDIEIFEINNVITPRYVIAAMVDAFYGECPD